MAAEQQLPHTSGHLMPFVLIHTAIDADIRLLFVCGCCAVPSEPQALRFSDVRGSLIRWIMHMLHCPLLQPRILYNRLSP